MTTRERLPRLAAALADVLPDADAEALARVMDAMAAGVLDPAARAALLAPDTAGLVRETLATPGGPPDPAARAALRAPDDDEPDAGDERDAATVRVEFGAQREKAHVGFLA